MNISMGAMITVLLFVTLDLAAAPLTNVDIIKMGRRWSPRTSNTPRHRVG